ncbi:mannose-ethanolamine phosphotransferase GPI11 [Lachancea thermotolerans CBS 6340]|uniref:Glycosylphosphatidylinositol anchor biosynthesis protein 11 n=1 Tax=Lachancea thermotolerans (strain ATCC 56472 / CBS 6340 / NRRL Y-8284) TaxID=559295 RepID=C5DM48_LACTC|nr:KLTH0G05962p [Lachancea thermotolerans CBS 6340]CAR24859.1 KLTH0G05962p [Lachancea thermotolerans CBS 6340]
MPPRMRVAPKKTVSFSDDENMTRARQLNSKKHQTDIYGPPVYVKKSLLTVPVHLVALLYYYIKLSEDFDDVRLLYGLIPMQIAYLAAQFNRSTVYGHKILKLKLSLVPISLGAALLLTLPCMLIIILMGAPVRMLLRETWLLAAHCCFLAFPAVYSVFNCDFKVGIFKKYFISIAIGCWISCIVIPLDWDRDWQQWPTPLIVGAYAGAFVGYSLCPYL